MLNALLEEARTQRRDADQKWEVLVEKMLSEFSKQTEQIQNLKLEGKIDSPIASQLLKSMPRSTNDLGISPVRKKPSFLY